MAEMHYMSVLQPRHCLHSLKRSEQDPDSAPPGRREAGQRCNRTVVAVQEAGQQLLRSAAARFRWR